MTEDLPDDSSADDADSRARSQRAEPPGSGGPGHTGEALRRSEEQVRLLIENAVEFAIFSTDLQRRVTVWNTGAERLLGYTEEEVLGQPGDIIFVEEDRAQGAPEREAAIALATGRASDDRWHRRMDGSRFWASGAMMRMLDASGAAVGFVKILRDMTAAREAQDALEQSQAQLLRVLADNERARIELQAADSAKDRFLAVLSHELRNPLASIDGAVELMLSGEGGAAQRDEAMQVVKRQAAVMKALLDDLLDVSRLKLGRLQLRLAPTRLSAFVNASLESTRPLILAAGHTLRIDLPPQEVELPGDELRLAQVVANLLVNAAKYTPRGGTVTLKARARAGQLELTVRDTGVGIDPARIGGMFEMFAQGRPDDGRSQGLGIGLALVKNIVELHGGQVHGYSGGTGKGSEFRVVLPGAREVGPAAPETGHAAMRVPPPLPKGSKRGTILIADDNEDVAWAIARLLEIAGFGTIRVHGGVDAVRQIQRRKPEVGIIDIGMPDLDGHEVARQVRASEGGHRIVLVAATGWGQEVDAREALQAGFDAHMTKPVDLRKLSALVDELMARRS